MRPTIVVLPDKTSAVYWKDTPVVMTDDSVGGNYRMKMHRAGNIQSEWLQQVAENRTFTLVDVGGNVGLFTRQALIACSNIKQVHVYEPDPQNFEHLRQNTAPWADKIQYHHYALSNEEGHKEFYQDPHNCGNYSLLSSAMNGCPYFVEQVVVADARHESRHWVAGTKNILYKSDTQGFDEELATLIDPIVWEYTFAAILEIWRIRKPEYDMESFRDILKRFSSRRFLGTATVRLSVDEIVEYASGIDGGWLDLVLEK